jgi:hypothetical protein
MEVEKDSKWQALSVDVAQTQVVSVIGLGIFPSKLQNNNNKKDISGVYF